MTQSKTYLGINLLHDTSAALLRDGVLIAAVEQERFDGRRHSSHFPREAIDYCLKQAAMGLDELSGIGVAWGSGAEGKTLGALQSKAMQAMRENGLHDVTGIRHHLCHAAGAFFSSGFESSGILVADGAGGGESTSLYFGHGLAIDPIKSYGPDDSLGHLYSDITRLCGLYTHAGQEGKTMGLSAYGRGKLSLMDSVLQFSAEHYHIDKRALQELKEIADGEPFSEVSKELAFAGQQALESALVFLANDLHQKTGSRNLCLAGGVALNCNANSRMAALDGVDRLYVQPAANAAGAAVGAAMLLHVRDHASRPVVKEQVYLGPQLKEDAVESFLRANRIAYSKIDNAPEKAAQLIDQGKIIGWIQGAMEFGPRALGNRSILASPVSAKTRDKVNAIKKREPWRPLAPAVLKAHSADWFDGPAQSPFMLLTLKVKAALRDKVPAITHVDGTARVQTVTQAQNERFYSLIEAYRKLSGIPMVLNTSLNTQSRPMATSVEACVQCLYEGGLDAMLIGDILILNE